MYLIFCIYVFISSIQAGSTGPLNNKQLKKVCNVNGDMTDIEDRLGKETYRSW